MFVDIFNTDRKYNVIYADPPWMYKDKGLSGNRGAVCKYDVMDIEDICRLPVKELAADNCVLFMWVTMSFLCESFKVIDAWGFKYKTCAFTWVKQNKKSDSLFWGMGHWTRANAELCLLAIKGNLKRIDAGVHSVIISHIEEHSKKPLEVRNRIDRLLGREVKKIELFARQKYPDWDCWGNEVSGDEINQQGHNKVIEKIPKKLFNRNK